MQHPGWWILYYRAGRGSGKRSLNTQNTILAISRIFLKLEDTFSFFILPSSEPHEERIANMKQLKGTLQSSCLHMHQK